MDECYCKNTPQYPALTCFPDLRRSVCDTPEEKVINGDCGATCPHDQCANFRLEVKVKESYPNPYKVMADNLGYLIIRPEKRVMVGGFNNPSGMFSSFWVGNFNDPRCLQFVNLENKKENCYKFFY